MPQPQRDAAQRAHWRTAPTLPSTPEAQPQQQAGRAKNVQAHARSSWQHSAAPDTGAAAYDMSSASTEPMVQRQGSGAALASAVSKAFSRQSVGHTPRAPPASLGHIRTHLSAQQAERFSVQGQPVPAARQSATQRTSGERIHTSEQHVAEAAGDTEDFFGSLDLDTAPHDAGHSPYPGHSTAHAADTADAAAHASSTTPVGLTERDASQPDAASALGADQALPSAHGADHHAEALAGAAIASSTGAGAAEHKQHTDSVSALGQSTDHESAAYEAGEPRWCEEWCCWLSACSQYYHDGVSWQRVDQYGIEQAAADQPQADAHAALNGAASAVQQAVNAEPAWGGSSEQALGQRAAERSPAGQHVEEAAALPADQQLPQSSMPSAAALAAQPWPEHAPAVDAAAAWPAADADHAAPGDASPHAGWCDDVDFFEQMHVAEGRPPARPAQQQPQQQQPSPPAPALPAAPSRSAPPGHVKTSDTRHAGHASAADPRASQLPSLGAPHRPESLQMPPASRWQRPSVPAAASIGPRQHVSAPTAWQPPVQAGQPPDVSAAVRALRPTPYMPSHPAMRAGAVPKHANVRNAPLVAQQNELASACAAPSNAHAPSSVCDACTSNAGRPPLQRVAFGIGGRAALIERVQRAYGGSNPRVALCSIAFLPSVIARSTLPVAASLFSASRLKEWTGPLSERSGNPKALAAFAEARAAEAQTRGQTSLAVLWRLLGVMAKHKGCLVGGTLSGKGAGAAAAVLEVLNSAFGGACAASALNPDFAVAGPSGAAALQDVEAALLRGRTEEALQVALQAQLWPAAVVIAQAVGPEAVQTTLRALSAAAFTPGCPLHVFSLVATEDYASAADVLRGPALPRVGDGASATAGPGGQEQHAHGGMHQATSATAGPGLHAARRAAFVPTPDAGARPQWHATLVLLAAHRAAPDAIALGALGDRLWEAQPRVPGQSSAPNAAFRDRNAAHICYMLAGRAAESAFVAGSRFVLPGADHEGCPGTFATADALQRADLHTWCLQQSTGAAMYGMVPYYLMVCFAWAS
jgi:Sec23-binding domain of Sec16